MRHLVLIVFPLLLACSDDAFVDLDGDGYCGDVDRKGEPVTECSDGAIPGDCDESDPEINPFADEWCDGVDTDCDGAVDPPQSIDADAWYTDRDSDGYGDPQGLAKACMQPAGWVADNTDCNDDDASVNPGAGNCG